MAVGEVCVHGVRGGVCVVVGEGVHERVIPSRTPGMLQQARCRASGDPVPQRQAGVISLAPCGAIQLGGNTAE